MSTPTSDRFNPRRKKKIDAKLLILFKTEKKFDEKLIIKL